MSDDRAGGTLPARIAAIAGYTERAKALTAMIAVQRAATAADPAVGSQVLLLLGQLVIPLVDRSSDVIADAEAILLELAGIDRPTYDRLFIGVIDGASEETVEFARIEEFRAGIPDAEGTIERLYDAYHHFQETFAEAAEGAIARLEATAVMLVGHPYRPGPHHHDPTGSDRVVAVPVSVLNADERLVVIAEGTVSWATSLAVLDATTTVAEYLCAHRGGIDLGPTNPVAGDVCPFSLRIGKALDDGVNLGEAYTAAFLSACEVKADLESLRDPPED